MYYQNHMMQLSRESGLDTIDESGQAAERTGSLESALSRDSESRYFRKTHTNNSVHTEDGIHKYRLIWQPTRQIWQFRLAE